MRARLAEVRRVGERLQVDRNFRRRRWLGTMEQFGVGAVARTLLAAALPVLCAASALRCRCSALLWPAKGRGCAALSAANRAALAQKKRGAAGLCSSTGPEAG